MIRASVFGKSVNPAMLAGLLALLWLVQVALSQAAHIVAGVEGSPDWLAPSLTGLSGLIGAVMILLILALGLLYSRQGWGWLMNFLSGTGGGSQDPDQAGESPPTQAITRDLYTTIRRMEQYGGRSGELIEQAADQTMALVEIVKKLQRRAAEQAEIADSLTEALKAITSGDPLKIKQAAAGVLDQHISNLMLLSNWETDAEYWDDIAGLVATHLGAANRWRREYQKITASLVGEVATIKTRLMAAAAHRQVAEAARPMIQAQINLREAGRLLNTPVSEIAAPSQLFAPHNEYVLTNGQQ